MSKYFLDFHLFSRWEIFCLCQLGPFFSSHLARITPQTILFVLYLLISKWVSENIEWYPNTYLLSFGIWNSYLLNWRTCGACTYHFSLIHIFCYKLAYLKISWLRNNLGVLSFSLIYVNQIQLLPKNIFSVCFRFTFVYHHVYPRIFHCQDSIMWQFIVINIC